MSVNTVLSLTSAAFAVDTLMAEALKPLTTIEKLMHAARTPLRFFLLNVFPPYEIKLFDPLFPKNQSHVYAYLILYTNSS